MIDVLSVPGLEPAVAQLTGTLESGRLAPTWLIYGPAGTGKWALAHRFARALLCKQPAPWGCGQCPACRRSAAYAHSDLFLLYGMPTGGGTGKARDRFQQEFSEAFLDFKRQAPLLPYAEARNRYMPSERILDLVGWAYRKPGEGARKVAIVYEAELIVRTVIDKLLKLTEEPPADTTLILVSHSPEQIPATIRSRSRQVHCRLSGPKSLTQFLIDHGQEAVAAKRAVRQSRGAIGLALEALTIEEDAAPEPEALRLLIALGDPQGGALAEVQLMQWRSERKRAHDTLESWAALIHDIALEGLAEPALGADPGENARGRFAAFSDPKVAAQGLELIRETQGALVTNAHIGVALAALAGRLVRLGEGHGAGERIWPSPQNV